MPLNDSAAVDSTQLVACETGPSLIALSTSEVFGDHGETSRRSDSSHVSTYVRKSKHNIWNMYNYINTYISNSHTYPISIYILHLIYDMYIYILYIYMYCLWQSIPSWECLKWLHPNGLMTIEHRLFLRFLLLRIAHVDHLLHNGTQWMCIIWEHP